ncbi:MAG: histidine phosphatase family protein [Haloferacaceae archaeon]
MATVLLARHGETAWNRAGRVQGWAPTRLTERGRAQARDLATTVAAHDPDRLVASDLPRARETADRVAAATGLDVETDRRWRERHWGRLQGLDADGLYERFPRLSLTATGGDALDTSPEGGESLTAVRERVHDAWADLGTDLAPAATAVVVSHAVPIDAVCASATGRDFAEALLDSDRDTGTLIELRVEGGRTEVAGEVSPSG